MAKKKTSPAHASSRDNKPRPQTKSQRGKSKVSAAIRNRTLVVRSLRLEDYAAVATIQKACFPNIMPWSKKQFSSQIKRFAEGQIGIEIDGQLVATSSSLIINRSDISPRHTFDEACADSTLANHNPDGDTLYGIDIAVLPKHRGKRLARRIYDARKDLITDHNLRSMLIAGRMPNYHKHAKKLKPETYLSRVIERDIRDPVILAQCANGFVPLHVIRNYLPNDAESCGHAVLMEWFNPEYVSHRPGRKPPIDDVRVAAVQYQMRPVASFAEFCGHVEFFVDTASDYRCDFICFPELITNQLLSIIPKRDGDTAMDTARRLADFTEPYVSLFVRLAMHYNINIIGGTHLTVEDDHVYNDAYLFRRDGSVARQRKIHITPSEAQWWGVQGGDSVQVFDTDCGPIAILICYDVEFPELARIARAQGAQMIFVPFNTDIRPSYLRVRTCAAARCIENNVYCILSGPVGNLPLVDGSDIHYAQACILTPSDIPFSRDGIGAEGAPNIETLCIHELDMSLLRYTLSEGSVRTWLDRRHDMYQLTYAGQSVTDHLQTLPNTTSESQALPTLPMTHTTAAPQVRK